MQDLVYAIQKSAEDAQIKQALVQDLELPVKRIYPLEIKVQRRLMCIITNIVNQHNEWIIKLAKVVDLH